MEYLFLAVASVGVAVQNIFKKKYNNKKSGGVFLFSAMTVLVACLFFVVINRDWYYAPGMIRHSFGFAVYYSMAAVFGVLAIREGSLAKTNLISSFSLLIPSFYGILFLGEPTKATLFIGIAVLAAALVLINYTKEKDDKKATYRWLIYVALCFIGNGMCSTVQKIEIMTFGSEGKNVFMIIALLMSAAVLFGVSLFSSDERAKARDTVKSGTLLAVLCGLFNGLVNLFVMLLNGMLPASVMFPVISAAGVTIVFIYSSVVEKEKFTNYQKLGYLLGVIAIILLNL